MMQLPVKPVVLPAPPKRNVELMRRQFVGGTALLLALAVAALLGTHWLALTVLGLPEALETPILVLLAPGELTGAQVMVYTEVGLGLLAWAVTLLVDPGVIQRDPSHAIPPQIIHQLETASEPCAKNIVDGDATYCVRCYVWREASPKAGGSVMCRGGRPHHCSVCQRCVRHFDHHCGILGWCIAGQGFQGNLWCFNILLAMGALSGVTTAGAVLLAIHLNWGPIHAVGAIGVFAIAQFLFNNVGLAAAQACRAWREARTWWSGRRSGKYSQLMQDPVSRDLIADHDIEEDCMEAREGSTDIEEECKEAMDGSS